MINISVVMIVKSALIFSGRNLLFVRRILVSKNPFFMLRLGGLLVLQCTGRNLDVRVCVSTLIWSCGHHAENEYRNRFRLFRLDMYHTSQHPRTLTPGHETPFISQL